MAKALVKAAPAAPVTAAPAAVTTAPAAPVTAAPAAVTTAPVVTNSYNANANASAQGFFATMLSKAKAAPVAAPAVTVVPSKGKGLILGTGITATQCQAQAQLGTSLNSKNLCKVIANLGGLPMGAVLTWAAGTTCPWPAHTLGAIFYRAVLQGNHNGITIGQAVQNAVNAKVNLGASGALGGHLVWFICYYASSGTQLNGVPMGLWQGTQLWATLQSVIAAQAAPVTVAAQ